MKAEMFEARVVRKHVRVNVRHASSTQDRPIEATTAVTVHMGLSPPEDNASRTRDRNASVTPQRRTIGGSKMRWESWPRDTKNISRSLERAASYVDGEKSCAGNSAGLASGADCLAEDLREKYTSYHNLQTMCHGFERDGRLGPFPASFATVA